MNSTVNSNNKRQGIFSWKALTLAVTTALCAPMVMGQDYTKIIEKSQGRDFKEVVAEVEELYKGKNKGQGTGYKQFRRWADFNSGRLTKDGKVQNISAALLEASNKYDAYLRKANKNSRIAAATPSWSLVGAKSNIRLAPGYGNGNGRVDRLAADPANASILYAGSPAGGLWRSTTGGASWTCLTNSMPSLVSVIGIAVDPSSPVSNRTIYFLSGNDGGFTGIFKSTNNGSTWSPNGLADKAINNGRELVMHPTNPQILFAVTSSGIFRTTTGGNSWDLVKGGDFHDLKFKPGSPNTIYASTDSQVFISNSGGNVNSWTQLTVGLPTNIFGKVLLAVSPMQPSYVYVLYGSELKIHGEYSGLYRSTNSGTSFTRRSNTPNILGYADDGSDEDNMSGHSMTITVSPANADEVHVASVNCWKSTTGGSTWVRTSKWGADFAGPGDYTHADVHHLYFVGNTLYCASDGGVFKSTNHADDWTEINYGLEISQIKRIGVDEKHMDKLLCGLQDNGVNYISNQTLYHFFGADGCEVFASPIDSNTMFGAVQYGGLLKTTDNGNTTVGVSPPNVGLGDWTAPFMLDPNVPTTLYSGYADVYKSLDNGGSWSNISNGQIGFSNCEEMAVAPSNSQYIYTSKGSSLYKTTNGGTQWTEVDNGATSGEINDIQSHPTNENIIFVVRTSSVYKVTFGTTVQWQALALASLPSVSYNTLALDKRATNNAMYLGTDLGVYYRDDDTQNWIQYSAGLPKVVVTDLEIHYATNTVQIGTYGRGAWKSPLYGTTGISVRLTSPSVYSEIFEGNSVTLTATATTSAGSISKVAFFLNGSKIHETTTPPYTYTMNNVFAGLYEIHAKAYNSLNKVTSSNHASVKVWKYRSANNPVNTVNGLDYKYYEGNWSLLPNFNLLTPVKKGSVPTFSIDPRNENDYLGFQYKGFVEVPVDGVYTFYLASDDGSKLLIGDTTLIMHDGFHGMNPVSERIALRAGKHPIAVDYFQGAGGYGLQISYAGPSVTRQEIPATALFRYAVAPNEAPSAQVTYPLDGATFSTPANITIEATAFDPEANINRVDFYKGTELLGSDFSAPYSFVWEQAPVGTHQIKAVAVDNGFLGGHSPFITVNVNNAPSCVLDEPAPLAAQYILRNDWNDQTSGASLSNESGSLKVAHRAWGKNELWLIETGKSFNITSGKSYQVKLDFKDFATYGISGLDVGFANGLNSNGNGPALTQPVATFAAGYSSSSFTTKTLNITASTSGNVNLVIRIRWASQPSVAVSNFIKNIYICANNPAPIVTDIDEINEPELSITPNPSSLSFTVSTHQGIQTLVVTNALGGVVYSANRISEGVHLEFGSNLSPGIYNVSVFDANGSRKMYRVVKR